MRADIINLFLFGRETVMWRKQLSFLTVALVVGLVGGSAVADITTGLVGYWPLDGDTRDVSGNGLNGTIVGNVQFAEDRDNVPGAAALFPGVATSYIDLGNPTALQFDGALTLAAWARVDSYETNGRIIARQAGSGRQGWSLNVEGEQYGHVGAFHVAPDAATFVAAETKSRIDFSPQQWFHIAGVYRPGQAMEIYINGQLNNVRTDSVPAKQFVNDASVYIGNRTDCCPFAGSIDDVHVFNRSLSEADIFELYAGHLPLTAYHPEPAVGAVQASTWASLVWLPGHTAVSHDVYIGDNFADVNDGTGGTFRVNLPAASTSFFVGLGMPGDPYPAGLTPGTTYYWRIDEVEADGLTKHKGEIWSFSIPPSTAYAPNPGDGAKFQQTDLTLSWTAGMNAKLHTVYFGQSFADVSDGAAGTNKGATSSASFAPATLAPATTYYWRIDEFDGFNAYKGAVWSFTTMPVIPIADPNLVGWWKTEIGEEGTRIIDWSGHNNHGTIMAEKAGTVLRIPTLFETGLEFLGDRRGYVELPPGIVTTAKGSILMWINTTQGDAANNDEGMLWWACQTNAGDGYGSQNEIHLNIDDPGNGQLDFFLEGGTAGDVTLDGPEVGSTGWRHVGATWDLTDGCRLYVDGLEVGYAAHNANVRNFVVMRLGRPYGTGSGNCYYDGLMDDVRLFNHAISAAQVAQIMSKGENPLRAFAPSPAHNALAPINQATPLSWSPGEKASQHDVYFGTDRDAVAGAEASDTSGVYRGRQAATSYTPPQELPLSSGPYYWRVDEISTDGTITAGALWTFSVADHVLVEDFESYNDIPAGQAGSNLVYMTWLDGYGTTTNGSTMGYPTGASMEAANVFDGKQSVALFYNNTAAGISEVTANVVNLKAGRDWSKYGAKGLTLRFYGDPNNVPQQMYVKLNGAKVPYDGDAQDLKKPGWQMWYIDLVGLGVNLSNVNTLTVGFERTGAIGGQGFILLDGIRLYAYDRQLITPVQPEPAGLVGHWKFDEATGTTALDSAGADNNGTLANTVTWQPTAGILGGALLVDPADGLGYCAVPTTGMNPAAGTFMVWINLAAAQPARSRYFVGHTGSTTGSFNNRLQLRSGEATGGNVLALGIGDNRNLNTNIMPLQTQTWYHVAATWEAGNYIVYVNGQLMASGTYAGFSMFQPLMDLGNDGNTGGVRNEAFAGLMDDAKVYDRALSYAEIAGIAGVAVPFDKPF